MTAPTERRLPIGHGWFDPLAGELSIDGQVTKLRPRTAALLAYLVRHADRVVGKDELLREVWPEVIVTEDSLVQCVKEIRRALGGSGDWIRTMPRRGYAFAPTVSRAGSSSAEGPTAAGDAPAPRRRWAMLAVLGGVAVLAAVAVLLLRDSGSARPPAPPLSIVVLPLANLSGDAAREDAVDDMTERLTDALSRLPGALVIAPSTAFTFKGKTVDVRRIGTELGVRYVLSGSLRQQDAQLSLRLRLADAASAAQLWDEEFSADAQHLAALRGDVVARVASGLGLRLIRAEAQRSQREQPHEPAVADLLLRARAELRWTGQGGAGIARARPLLEEAARRDPGSAEAWALLVRVYLDEIRFKPDREFDLQRAAEAAERAVALAPDSSDALGSMARVLYNQARMPQALGQYDRALELNPNDPEWQAQRGAALVMLGRSDAALRPIGMAMRLSPRDPQLPLWQMFQGVAYLHLERDADAVQVLQRSVEGNPRSAFAHLFLASALGLSGRIPEAQQHAAEVQRLRPGFTLERMRAREPSDAPAFQAQRERVYEGLRRAGMPE